MKGLLSGAALFTVLGGCSLSNTGPAHFSGLHSAETGPVYALPYAPGKKFKVTQGFLGEKSHHGQYAIDWKMREGTPIHAARSGVVVRLKEDSNSGGPSRKYLKKANFVSIQHADGTIGFYCHLKRNGVVVKKGDYVQQGQLIAYSGNTGFSTGPHLHFAVLQHQEGKTETLPIKFQVSRGSLAELKEGRSYRAVHSVQPASALASKEARQRPVSSDQGVGSSQ